MDAGSRATQEQLPKRGYKAVSLGQVRKQIKVTGVLMMIHLERFISTSYILINQIYMIFKIQFFK